MKIEEVLGYHSSASSDADSVTKKYYVRCDVKNGVVLETPEQAKAAFENSAMSLLKKRRMSTASILAR